MKLNQEYKFAIYVLVSFAFIYFMLVSNEFNSFVSSPIVSGVLVAIVASFIIPKRMEAESKRALENGFYEDMAFISERYKKFAFFVAKCAAKKLYDENGIPSAIEYGNESLHLSRLNQSLALKASQKEALIRTENAVRLVNGNLGSNASNYKAVVLSGGVGYHHDGLLKAAFDGICYIIFTTEKLIELKERFVINEEPLNLHIEPALQILYPDDKKTRERMLLWLTSERSLLDIVIRDSQPA